MVVAAPVVAVPGLGVNHAIANEGQVNATIGIFSYILAVFAFDWTMLKAAQLVERPRDWRQRQLMSGPRHITAARV